VSADAAAEGGEAAPRTDAPPERDTLFLPNFLDSRDKLRIFGSGRNLVSFTYVDNYAHGLILGHAALRDGSPALGNFYLVTDGPPQNFWHTLDRAITRSGGASLQDKTKVPRFVLFAIAYVLKAVTALTGVQFRLNPFNVRMLTIDRYFDVSDAVRDLGYAPIVDFERAWDRTVNWFSLHEPFWRACAAATSQGNAPSIPVAASAKRE